MNVAWITTDLADVLDLAQSLVGEVPEAHDAAYSARNSSPTAVGFNGAVGDGDPTGEAVASEARSEARRAYKKMAKAIAEARTQLLDAKYFLMQTLD